MITLRRADERGRFDFGWLDTRHTFSFGDYYDPDHMGFRTLRVLNEDRVQPGQGFPTHPHRDMEIVTYVLEGALAHKDSMGNGSTILPGEVQRMSAGTGVTHSEYNHAPDAVTHFLQIWIRPERPGLQPSYEQVRFPSEELRDSLRLLASRDGRDGSVTVHQDVALYGSRLGAGREISHTLAPGRAAWVQVARGTLAFAGLTLGAGDGVSVLDGELLALSALTDAEFLLFDLA